MTGYESKRAAAQDKLEDDDTQVYQDHDDTLTIAYQSGFYDGKKAAAQEPTKYSFRAHWEEDGCIGVVAAIERLDGGVHLLKDTIDAPQPAQEPVVYEFGCSQCGHTQNEEIDISQRPWVDLTDEEIGELIIGTLSADTNPAQTRPRDVKFARSVLAKFKEKNT